MSQHAGRCNALIGRYFTPGCVTGCVNGTHICLKCAKTGRQSARSRSWGSDRSDTGLHQPAQRVAFCTQTLYAVRMRIVLLADTHGFLDPRVAALCQGVDLLVHAGDVGTGIDTELAQLCPEVLIVAGNNDPGDCPWPSQVVRALPGGDLAVMHGHQWPAGTRHTRLRARFADAGAIVCGHSHRRVLDTDYTPWLLNPGAAGRTRAYGGPSCIELWAQRQGWRTKTHVFDKLARR